MHKVNFHSLDELTVPPELIKRALAIPDEKPSKPDTPPRYRRTKVIAAAASVAAVILAGLSVFLFLGNRSLPVKPAIPLTERITEAAIPPTHPSEAVPTEAVSEAAQTENEPNTAPTPAVQTPLLPPATEPLAERPTEPVTEAATQRPAPTDAPTEIPSAPVTEPPPVDSPTENDKSGEPSIPGTVEGGSISSYAPTDRLTGQGGIFCVLYYHNGERVDHEAILSPAHQASITAMYEDCTDFLYCPPQEWGLETAMYDMEIYNEDGEMIRQTAVFLYNGQ